MAETPPHQSPTRTRSQPGSGPDSSQYWCYHCDKRVAIESPNDVVCYECKSGFVESISAATLEPINDDAVSGEQFVQILRLIAQTARDDDAPLNLPSDLSDEDYRRVELEDEDEHSVEVVEEVEYGDREQYVENNESDGDEEDEFEAIEPRGDDDDDDEEEEEEELRSLAREVFSRRLMDFANRASRAERRRNRILDWAEILMGLEDSSIQSIEQRLRVSELDSYVGNPGDYVDAAGYEALLQNLAESDSGGRNGAPPAAKSAVEGLKSVVIEKEEEVVDCAICKDLINVGEVAKNLPCGHGYHGECIVPWLGTRNSCPVCRFELSTDDSEYEEDRRKRVVVAGLRAGSTSSSGGGGSNS